MESKKIWSMLHALYFMFRKNKSKKIKYMLDLSMMIKRGKFAAGKALHIHMFKDSTVVRHHSSSNVLPGEYVFSCSNTPLFRLNKIRNGNSTSGYRFFFCAQGLHTKDEDEVVRVNIEDIKALEMLQNDVASLVMTGVGRSPVVRVTDSPYPISEVHGEDDNCVDEAAEEFIIKFYRDLKKQNLIASS